MNPISRPCEPHHKDTAAHATNNKTNKEEKQHDNSTKTKTTNKYDGMYDIQSIYEYNKKQCSRQKQIINK
jgi:hypothetical protein